MSIAVRGRTIGGFRWCRRRCAPCWEQAAGRIAARGACFRRKTFAMSYFFANIASWNRVQSTAGRVQIQLRTSLSPHNLKTSEPLITSTHFLTSQNLLSSEAQKLQNLKTSEPQNLKISLLHASSSHLHLKRWDFRHPQHPFA